MSKKGAKGKGGKAKSKGGHNQQTGSTAPQAPPQAVEELETQQLPKFPPYEKLRYAPTCPLDTIEPIQKLLGTPLRITLSDGRFIIGELSSLDNYRNLILSNTYQAHINTVPGAPENSSTKQMNTTLIPGDAIVKIEVGRPKVKPSEAS